MEAKMDALLGSAVDGVAGRATEEPNVPDEVADKIVAGIREVLAELTPEEAKRLNADPGWAVAACRRQILENICRRKAHAQSKMRGI